MTVMFSDLVGSTALSASIENQTYARRVARRIFEALCVQYPDRYIAPADTEIAAASLPQSIAAETGTVSLPRA